VADYTDPKNPVQVPQCLYQLLDKNDAPLTAKVPNNLTISQWNNWAAGVDADPYLLQCVAANVGLTLIP